PRSRPSSKAMGSMLWFCRYRKSCMPSPTKRSRLIESTSCTRSPASGLRRKNAAEKYSIFPDDRSSGRSPFTVSRRWARKRVSEAKRPAVSPSRSPISSQMQNVDPSRIVSCVVLLIAARPAGSFRPDDARSAGLAQCLDHDLVDVHVRRTRECKHHAGGDILRRQRVESAVDGLRLLGVALEA